LPAAARSGLSWEKAGERVGEGSGSSSSSSSYYANCKKQSLSIDAGPADISRDIRSASGASGDSGDITTASMTSSTSTVGPAVGIYMHLILSNSSPRLVAATKVAWWRTLKPV